MEGVWQVRQGHQNHSATIRPLLHFASRHYTEHGETGVKSWDSTGHLFTAYVRIQAPYCSPTYGVLLFRTFCRRQYVIEVVRLRFRMG